MKKLSVLIIVGICMICLYAMQSFAAVQVLPCKIIVQLESSLSSKDPPKTIVVVANNDYKLPNSKILEKGSEIHLEITKVNEEKVGKINANIQAKVTKLYFPSKDETIIVTNPNATVTISHYEKLDIADKTIDTGITVANHFVKNIAAPAHFAKGAVMAESGNRLNSGFKETYDKSVLSYTGKGQALDFKAGDLVTMSFYVKDSSNNKK